MRLLALLVLFALFPAHVSPTGLSITPVSDVYYRGDTITISGKIVSGNAPVSGADVYLFINGSLEDSTTTLPDGSFEFSYTIPLDRPPGSVMNVTVYYPGDAFHYPSSDYALIEVYGRISADARINGTDGISEEFPGSSSIRVFGSAVFDNGTQAPIDRYIEVSYEAPSGGREFGEAFNDTAAADYRFDVSEPVAGSVTVRGYCDFRGFVFSTGSASRTKELPLELYDSVSISIEAGNSTVGGNSTVTLVAGDSAGLLDALDSAISADSVALDTPGGYAPLVDFSKTNNGTHIIAEYVFAIPPSRGGLLRPELDASFPDYMRVSLSRGDAYAELEDVSIIFPPRYPEGVKARFVPLLRNDLTNETRPLMRYASIFLEYGHGLLEARGNYLVIFANGTIGLNVTAEADSDTALFRVSEIVELEAISVRVSTNATDELVLRPHENVTLTFELSPRPSGFEAAANVTIGDSSSLMRFDGTLEVRLYADGIANGTMIEVSIGHRNASIIVYISAGTHELPGPSASTKTSALEVITAVLLILLFALLAYLVYLIIRRLDLGKKKARVVQPHEPIINRLRKLYASGNYKLLSVEAYKFLTAIIAPRVGVSAKPNDTPRKLAEKLIAAGLRTSLVMDIVNAYEIAKYSPRDVDEETAQKVVAAVSALAKEYLARPAR